VNGQARQDATTEDLIFSVPFLIKTLSEGQTLMPGDVLATGTVSRERAHRRKNNILTDGSLLV
jgi:2-keto-4-pentenoate hydratase/2-oxohepta-3-ene-1,7-dioic acid hydratase in catechol pathway